MKDCEFALVFDKYSTSIELYVNGVLFERLWYSSLTSINWSVLLQKFSPIITQLSAD